MALKSLCNIYNETLCKLKFASNILNEVRKFEQRLVTPERKTSDRREKYL